MDTLRKEKMLNSLDVWAIAFGCIVGWGAFVMPRNTFLPLAGPTGTLIGMLISTVIMVVIGLNYSYLMKRMPDASGVYAYTKEAFGREHAFLCSWFLSLSYVTVVFMNATALFLITRTVLGTMLQVGPHYTVFGFEIYFTELAVSTLSLVLAGVAFLLNNKLLQIFQTVMALVLIIGVAIVFFACLPKMLENGVQPAFATADPKSNFLGVFIIVLLAPWAFVGFEAVSFETRHYGFPVKRAKLLIPLAILCGTFAYVGLNYVSVSVLPEGYANWSEYIAEAGSLSGIIAVPTFFAASSTMGKAGIVIISLAALGAIFTGIIGAFRASTRLLITMSEDNILPKRFLNPKYSITFIMLFSIAISFIGRNALEWFVEMTSFGALVAYGYASASAGRLAKREGNKPATVFGYAGLAFSVVFIFTLFLSRIGDIETMGAEAYILLAIWCLLGFFFYWRTMHASQIEGVTYGLSPSNIFLFLLLTYSIGMWFVKKVLYLPGTESYKLYIVGRALVTLFFLLVGLYMTIYIQKRMSKQQEELERRKIYAEESNSAKSRFLFNMSHDIRTPMNAILGYTHLAAEEEGVPDQVREYISKIDTSGQHLLMLINDVLEMSRIETGHLTLEEEPGDICAAVSSSYDMFTTQMKTKNITYRLNIHGVTDRYAVFDEQKLVRILLNLVGNAYKFTPEGKSVTVSFTQLPSENEEDKERAVYELRVKDTGIGMSEEFAATIFEAFARERTTTVSKTEGTGLGMAITKSIVDAMNGTIVVNTKAGEGTEFVITLPLVCASAADVETEADAEAEAVSLEGMKILLVDDNEINREIATLILETEGCVITSAEDGQVALNIMSAAKPGDYDVILMDVQMPVMDGYTATGKIRELPDKAVAAIPIIAVTANAFKEDEIAARNAGMDGHVPKPIEVEKLKHTLSDILNNPPSRNFAGGGTRPGGKSAEAAKSKRSHF